MAFSGKAEHFSPLRSTWVDISEFKEGSLIIELVDVSKDQLIWQVIDTAELNEHPKGREERNKKTEIKILDGFLRAN